MKKLLLLSVLIALFSCEKENGEIVITAEAKDSITIEGVWAVFQFTHDVHATYIDGTKELLHDQVTKCKFRLEFDFDDDVYIDHDERNYFTYEISNDTFRTNIYGEETYRVKRLRESIIKYYENDTLILRSTVDSSRAYYFEKIR